MIGSQPSGRVTTACMIHAYMIVVCLPAFLASLSGSFIHVFVLFHFFGPFASPRSVVHLLYSLFLLSSLLVRSSVEFISLIHSLLVLLS
eukprot:m.82024 g.82024  ORF g.82024 m.82024 type:complete len:89 (-) comp14277_c0_seq4:2932-3198(-)